SSAPTKSLLACSTSAALMVGSSSIIASPVLTDAPSRMWIARTTPASNGWTILIRPLGTILPGAVATTSTVASDAQIKAAQNTATMVTPTAWPIGDGGVSM